MTADANDTAMPPVQRKTLAERAYEFIWERDPFGDHFSQHDLETIRAATIPVRDMRDYFAAAALMGLSTLLNGKDAPEAARRAYQAADAMMEARK
jgi:hypothetical protein